MKTKIFTYVFLIVSLVIAVIGFTTTTRSRAATPIKIMPMGDSITQQNAPGYRGYLYNSLVAAGYSVDFVGTQSDLPSNGGDPDNEGHGGYTIGPGASSIGNLYDNVDSYFAATPQVDVVLLMIGTNQWFNMTDPNYNPDTQAAPQLAGLIDKIYTNRPNVTILVASILPFGWDSNVMNTYNGAIPGIVNTRAQQGKKIYFVNMHDESGFVAADFSPDNLHPSASGYSKVANVWYNHLTPILSGAATPTAGPTNTATPANLALNKTATASSVEAAGFEAAKAFDGNATTRWSSVDPATTAQWLQVDLGATYNISGVNLTWESAYASGYQIQTSNDASTWTTIYSTTTGDGATDNLTGLSGSGRYVRMNATVRGTAYGYALWEMAVYGSAGPTAVPATVTKTNTPAVPTATKTNTPVGPTVTRTNTAVVPTNTPAGMCGSTNAALNKTASASSVEAVGYEAAKAFDGSTTTRWSSVDPATTAQWLQVDLGSTQSICRVNLNWEGAYASGYQIQTSNDASTWTTIYTTTTGDGATDDLTGLSGSGRYVRVNATTRATVYGYSIWEMQVYTGSTGPTNTPVPATATRTNTPAPATATKTNTPAAACSTTNLALNKIASASSVETTGYEAGKAVDGSATTRWSSVDPATTAQWLQVDLGSIATGICHINLTWEAAYASGYQIQTSNDASTWTTIYTTTTGDGATDDLTGLSGSGRYVRVNATTRGTAYGYSIWEFQVFGNSGPTPTPGPTATITKTPTAAPTQSGTRDKNIQPFASNSIWNMPIHNSAQYVAAGIGASTAWGMTEDQDVIVLSSSSPATTVYNNTWDGTLRCTNVGGLLTTLPIPANFLVPLESGTPNHAAGILQSDGRTIFQAQPFTRCVAGGPAYMTYTYPSEDIYGAGIEGAHGGSGMSSVGGTIRLGELVPGGVISHALKVNLYAAKYIQCTGDSTNCYRWPAVKADGYAVGNYAGKVSALEMGALLALQPSFNINSLQTEPAKIIARAFQNYGGYVVDDTAWDVYAIETSIEPGGNTMDQFKTTWGYDYSTQALDTPWTQDMALIFTNLYVINNNTPTTIGGGPNSDTTNRRAPMALPIGN